MEILVETAEQLLIELGEAEFCANKEIIQKWITAQKNSIEAKEKGLKKDALILLNNIEQDAFNKLTNICKCS